MAQRKDIDGSMSVPTFYGKELRWIREAAGLSLEALLEGSFFGKTYLSDIERGERQMPVELARHVDKVLRTDGFFERHCEDVRKARRAGHAGYYEKALEAEKHAKTIEVWGPTILPGLLQTPAYCVEVADNIPGLVPVHDSKVPDGPALLLTAGAWAPFVEAPKSD
ncbi:Scr1 family TA system antitoxin-like transcriptional regulator [Streptomyces sp. NPDC005760]|uniref:Scr1 family TA system antitoxin-like transcriptional regulator n=1 Tax=Streptomyces sp. NPDC005760 TaxID=3156718 RepID=UPI0033C4339D